jgi:hypothetical protein
LDRESGGGWGLENTPAPPGFLIHDVIKSQKLTPHWLFCCGKQVKIKPMTKPRIYSMSFASVYPLYVAKAEKKGRTKGEVDELIRWLPGYRQEELEVQLEKQTDLETFYAEAPQMNPSRALIKGMVCGVRVEDIQEPTMQEIRYLDKLIDELARGKALEKILRKGYT